ncbi:nuclear nucleic acid-binding protein C1D, putative [Babesia ovis]|uniref:Nuclear nucleic acid-binding protein C1D, putative n=1 Tax=Babesia ovis TaxID=5869 RepID=A0A9W5TD67_BABOV|nr:nuclear nucleic acid-binding protein C1D, putative [Babesia ovis]
MLESTLSMLETKLDKCRELLDQLVECLLGCNIRDELTGLEYSKVFATISFTLCSLHYVNQKLKGQNPANHPISSELVSPLFLFGFTSSLQLRVKGYMQEINDIISKAHGNTIYSTDTLTLTQQSCLYSKQLPVLQASIPEFPAFFAGGPLLSSIEPLLLSYRDDLRREQFNRIVGKIGIRKKDAGIYWNQYKTKRIKIRKRRRVI